MDPLKASGLSDVEAAPATTTRDTAARYRPIRDYALIGDCHGTALVSSRGGIDWCCLERFDAEPVFCRILDADRGGHFTIAPAGPFDAQRSYLGDTNILSTEFETPTGRATLVDFMPVGRKPGSGLHDYVDLSAPHRIVRVLTGVAGRLEVTVAFKASRDYVRRPVVLAAGTGQLATDFGPVLYHPLPDMAIDGDTARARVDLRAGDRLVFVLAARPAPGDVRGQAERQLAVTRAFWQEWIAYCRHDAPHRDLVRRSALALKLLTYAPTGAIVAAPTTSLPEQIGAGLNWDYRFCWLRDSTFALYALAVLGYGGEARRFADFLGLVCKDCAPDIQIMYGIGGEIDLPEIELDHLDGYRGSRPVRIGNGAQGQRQMDVFGEMLDWADIYVTIGGRFSPDWQGVHGKLADFVAATWHEPDQGLWEMRGPALHHVHSKIMAWVTLDRAIKLYGNRNGWDTARAAIAQAITRNGFFPDGALKQSFDGDGVDAAVLTTPMLGYPLSPAALAATVAAVDKNLRTGDAVHRYRTTDGLDDGEGAFLICSFWLVDAMLALGRLDAAEALFDRLAAMANDVGLFAEEIEPASGDFLGNFPQALTHLALVASAAHLALCRRDGVAALAGTYADRASRMVGATLGWRAVWASLKTTRRVGRIRSSRASIMEN